MRRRLLSIGAAIIFAFAITLAGFSLTSDQEAYADTTTTTVYISSQAGNGFLHAPGYYQVSSDLAESYGYSDSVTDGVSALDVLVKAHELILGDDFTKDNCKDSLTVSGGFASSELFGGDNFGFTVGGVQPHNDTWTDYGYTGYTIDHAKVTDNQEVDFFAYQDLTGWSDSYATFSIDGSKVNNIETTSGAKFDLTLTGYSIAWFGSYKEETIAQYTEPIEDAVLAWVDSDGSITKITDSSGANVTTDEKGAVTLQIPEEKTGTILTLTAYVEGDDPIIMPLATISIKDSGNTTGTYVGGVTSSDSEGSSIPAITSTSKEDALKALQETISNVVNNVATDPVYGDDDWYILGLARAGAEVPEGYYDKYYNSVVETLKSNGGKLDERAQATDYERVILALTATGRDVTNVDGYNLVDLLKEAYESKDQNLNATIFGLITMNALDVNKNVSEDAFKDKLLKTLIAAVNEDYGFSLNPESDTSDVDITAMAVQALAPYELSNEEVRDLIGHAGVFIMSKQSEAGGYSSAETGAQAIVAMTSIGVTPDQPYDNRTYTFLDGLMKFYIGDGGFQYSSIAGFNDTSTQQGLYALAAYQRFLNDQPSLYDMSDVTITYAKANDNTASLDKNPSTGKDKVNQGSSVSVADSSVNTGDSMPLLPLMIIMILAVVVIIVVIVLSIRARRK